jgi:hypothetical protein
MIQRFLCVPSFLLLLSAATAAGAAAPSSQEALLKDLDRRADETDAQLHRGEWAKAEAGSREAIEIARKAGFVRPHQLALLALAEAGAGRSDDAVWDWQAALNLDPQALGRETLAGYGKAGELLAAHPARELDQAPAGLAVEPEGARGLQAARKIHGELPDFSAELRKISFPRWLRLQAVVDTQGRLRDPVVVSPVPVLADGVLAAVRSWEFEPARRDGAPVASYYDLLINPPGGKALTTLAPMQGELAEVEAALRAGRWEEGAKRADSMWKRALADQRPSRGFLAVAFTLRALAEAATHHEDVAICHWQAAQAMEPLLYHADLSAYGAPGALLSRHTWGLLAAEHLQRLGTESQISRPELVSNVKPIYPGNARASGAGGKVILETVVDEQGRIRDPRILAGPPAALQGFYASSLDSVCQWRFHPAKLAGKPTRVFYVLTVNYQISGPGGQDLPILDYVDFVNFPPPRSAIYDEPLNNPLVNQPPP